MTSSSVFAPMLTCFLLATTTTWCTLQHSRSDTFLRQQSLHSAKTLFTTFEPHQSVPLMLSPGCWLRHQKSPCLNPLVDERLGVGLLVACADEKNRYEKLLFNYRRLRLIRLKVIGTKVSDFSVLQDGRNYTEIKATLKLARLCISYYRLLLDGSSLFHHNH